MTTALQSSGKNGEFLRKESAHRNFVSSDPQSEFPAEANRYHLYVSYACPWANRCIAMRLLKGLEDVVGLSVVHPTWKRTRPDKDEHFGWAFAEPGEARPSPAGHGSTAFDDVVPDNHNNAKFIRDLYELSGDTNGPFSVPVLWDTKTKKIVNNESSEIVRMLNSEFNQVAKNPELDLAPKELEGEMAKAMEWIYPGINNGVYRCGFAKTQEAYDSAIDVLYESLDKLESVLSSQRYICGKNLTLTDICAFMTLVRFDEIYVVYFKTNKKTIREYPAILNFCREMYQTPGLGASVNMQHCKVHYFTSHPTLNTYAIVPVGPNFIATLKEEHNRARL